MRVTIAEEKTGKAFAFNFLTFLDNGFSISAFVLSGRINLDADYGDMGYVFDV